MDIGSEEWWDWVTQHSDADSTRLRLRHSGDPSLMQAIAHLEAARKASSKIPDTLAKNPRFIFPSLLAVEQCTSDRFADFHASFVKEGSSVIDMTCGLGIDSMHFAAKAANVTTAEINKVTRQAAVLNKNAMGLENLHIKEGDSTSLIDNGQRVDLVFIDPARRDTNGKRVYALSDCTPDVTKILPALRRTSDRILIKASPMLDISMTLRQLPSVTDIFIVGTAKECRELLILLDFSVAQSEPVIHAVTLAPCGDTDFAFKRSEEQDTSVTYAFPQPGMILYEPFPSVMKAAPFHLLSQEYGVAQLAPNTHLYVSSGVISDFPGEGFLITEVLPFNKRTVAEVRRNHPMINVSTRNFVMPAQELVKRLGVKDGGSFRLFGVRSGNPQKNLMVITSQTCEPSNVYPHVLL